MKKRIQLPSIDHCTGCQACRVVCPVNAITMQENKKGHIYPVVDEEICIMCNKCAYTCPEIKRPSFAEAQQKVYACWINDKYSRKYSTSGGISYALSRKIIDEGGVFCGVVYQYQSAEHQICNEINELYRFQGSKYVHSDVKNVYVEIENLLKAGKKVLFSGTPCQVAGLRAYLRKSYQTLFCIDILCHGVPSRKILRDRIQHIEATANGKEVKDIRFRDKNPDQHTTYVKYTFSDDSFVKMPVQHDAYFRCFVTNYSLRENCFNCQYSCIRRVGDITLADFWGYAPKRFKFHSYRKGTSLVIVNTNQGELLFQKLKKHITIDDTNTMEQAVVGNHNLKSPQPIPVEFDTFWTRYLNGETIEELMPEFYPKDRIIKNSIVKRIKLFISLLLPESIVRLLIKIKEL